MRMESDEFDFLAPAYVRGFLKTYARFLRLNADALLEDFDRRYGSGRFESQQIIALERHGKKHTPKEPRFSRSWSLAAFIAAGALMVLALVGLFTGPDDPGGERDTAVVQESPSPTEEAVASASPSPTTTDTAAEDALAFAEGIDLEIIATEADCWIMVSADGGEPQMQTLPQGETASFTAEEEMFVRLGFPQGVELVVNGENIGSPDGVDPVNLKFPDDIDLFL